MASQKFYVEQIPKENRNQKVWSRRAYVDWVNKILKAHYTHTNEFRNGALYVQLLDGLFPGVIPMDEVKFSAQKGYDCYKNFCILNDTFKKLGINKTFNEKALSEGRHVESWEFLKWFKLFYDTNFVEKGYDPLKARKNAYMGFGRSRNTIKSEMQVKKHTSQSAKPFRASHSGLNVMKKKVSKEKSENFEELLVKVNKISQPMDFRTNNKVKESFKQSKLKEKRSKGRSRYLNSSRTASQRVISGTESSESAKSSVKTVILKYGHAHGDFERKFAGKAMSEGRNVHSIVFDKTATYDEFKINISDNIQIRFENIKNASMKTNLSDPEKRRKINLLVEKFLEFQWIERKDYLDSIVEFLRSGEIK